MGNDQSLNIIVKLQDEASKAIGALNDKLTSVKKSMEPATEASKKFGLALGIAGAAVGAFGILAVKSAAEAEAQIASMDATLRTMGDTGIAARDKILSLSEGFVKLGFDDEVAAQSMAKLFQRTGDLGEALKLTNLAADFARAKHIDLATATNAVGMALSGNGKALMQYGINIKDAATPMEALAELQNKVGGQSEAFAGTLQGQMAVAKEQWSNFVDVIGNQLLPIVTKLMKAVNKFVQEDLQSWIDKTKQLIEWLSKHKGVVYAVAGAITGALIPAFIAMAASALAMGKAFIIASIPLLPWIIGGAIIGGIIAGIMWIIKHWDMISEKATEIWQGIADFFSGIWESITGALTAAWEGIKNFFSAIWDGIKAVFIFVLSLIVGIVVGYFESMGIDIVAVFQRIGEFFVEIWQTISETFSGAIEGVKNTWMSVWTAIGDFLGPIWEGIKSVASAGWNWLVDKFKAFTAPITAAWAGLWDGLTTGVKLAWEGVKNVVKSSINWIIEKINTVINAINTVAQKGAGVLGATAPQIPTIPMLAKGGIVNKPTLAMIGEAGPEAVVPLSKMGQYGGGSGVNITINYPEFKNADDESRMRRMLDEYFRPLLINNKITA